MDTKKAPNLATVAELLPWAVVGIIVLSGALTVLSFGLPWETRNEATITAGQIETQIGQLAVATQKNTDAVNALVTQMAVTQTEMKHAQEEAAAIDALRTRMDAVEADEKANDSERLARQARHHGGE